MKLVGYKATAVCAECGGSCCKRAPGIIYPADLTAVTAEEIARLLQTWRYAIDFWTEDDDSMTLFLRPRSADGSMIVPFFEFGGRCTFLTETGCELAFRERPQGCRMLQPGPTNKTECDLHGHSKEHGKNAWAPFQAEIKAAIDQCGELGPEEPNAFDMMSAVIGQILPDFPSRATYFGDPEEAP